MSNTIRIAALSLLALGVLGLAACSSAPSEAVGHTQSRIVGEDCVTSDDCCDGLFCQTDANACGAAGACAAKPSICPHDWVGVCGCDGSTYGNECLANAAGVSVAQEGACVPPVQLLIGTACSASADCGDGVLYCQSAEGACFTEGTCQPRGINVLCVATPDYVCGCDGVTYDNRCAAAKRGAAIDHAGGCAAN